MGPDVVKIYYEDGPYAWTMRSNTYLQKAIHNLKEKLEVDGFIFNKKVYDMNNYTKHPFQTTYYCPQIDNSLEFS